jgi:predicted DNA-binding transcriptional regulator YafY
MPKNKQAALRYKLIDKCFQRKNYMSSSSLNKHHKGYWKVDDLLSVIEEELGKRVSERTLKSDFENMQIDYNAPIVNKRGVGYKYKYDFSITDNPLSEKDFAILNEITEILHHYTGFKYFEDAETLISKIEENKTKSDYTRIQLDTLPRYTGLQFIEALKKAIFEKYVVGMDYETFSKEKLQVNFHPYLLKEYNNRWFVLGFTNKKDGMYGSMGLYALDRIKKIEPTELKYRKPNTTELNAYFSNIYGVTNKAEDVIEHIMVKLVKFRSMYLRTKPIHPSQKLIKEEEKYDYYQFKLKINNELISWILSFGKDIEVVEPLNFRNQIAETLKGALVNY